MPIMKRRRPKTGIRLSKNAEFERQLKAKTRLKIEKKQGRIEYTISTGEGKLSCYVSKERNARIQFIKIMHPKIKLTSMVFLKKLLNRLKEDKIKSVNFFYWQKRQGMQTIAKTMEGLGFRKTGMLREVRLPTTGLIARETELKLKL